MRIKDLSGEKFGRLTVLHRTEDHVYKCGRRDVKYRCMCDCGKEIDALAVHLRSGHTKSCGCFRAETTGNSRRKHGMNKTRIYNIWKNMKRRCLNESNPSFGTYGGRGIKVCDEWKDSFEPFMSWSMEHGYEGHLTIDRIDTNGNYHPGNCRWATPKEQCNNTRRNVFLEFGGERHTMSEWAEKLGVKYKMIQSRVKRGWPSDKVIEYCIQHTKSEISVS